MPRLSQLRAKYAAVSGCRMALGTVLRQPESQMLSEFLYFNVQFNRRLHGNATLQERALVSEWLRGRANPQLAWFRGRSCRAIGAIFLCSTPQTDGACGDDSNLLSHADGDETAPTAVSPALELLRSFDVVGTSQHLSAVVTALTSRVGFLMDPSTKLPHCNPPSKHGLLSLSALSYGTRRVLRAHSRCDQRLYEAALRRDHELLGPSGPQQTRHRWTSSVEPSRMVNFSIPFWCKAA